MAEVQTRGSRKMRVGLVISNRADKTILVEVRRQVAHRLYGKVMRRRSKFSAHDEENSAGIGDTVRIIETRPLRKTKRWRLAEILERAQ